MICLVCFPLQESLTILPTSQLVIVGKRRFEHLDFPEPVALSPLLLLIGHASV